MMNDTLKEQIRAKLKLNMEALCKRFLPNGKRVKNEWHVGSIAGEAGESLHVQLEGDKAGLWYDHATGEGGDVFGLWARAKNIRFLDALHEAARHVGITGLDEFEPPRKPKGFSRKNNKSMRGTEEFRHLRERGIKEATMETYHVRAHSRKSPHNTNFLAYQYQTPQGESAFLKSTGIKRTKDGKKDIWISPDSFLTLWGWQTVKPHHTRVCLTEGEEDAMSLHQMLGLNDIPVLSLPNGTGNLTWMENDFAALQQFDKIYLFLDHDGPGEAGAKKLAQRLGLSRCYRVLLPEGYKDCNDILVKAPESAHKPLEWIEKANTYDPQPLRKADEIADATILMRKERRAFEGGSFAFDVKFIQLPGECTILQGYTGHGKSTVAYQMANHDIATGKKVLFVSMEIPSEQVLENMCQQWVARFPRDEDIYSYREWLDGRLLMFDDEDDNLTWKSLHGYIEYVARRFDVKAVYLDSLHFFAEKRDYEEQDKVAREIKKLASKTRTHITLLAHSRYGEGGEYVIPPIDGVEGSKGVLKPFHNIITHWRNVKKEEALDEGPLAENYQSLIQQSDCVLWCSKQRNGYKKRWKQKLWFDFNSMTFRTEEGGPKKLRPVDVVYKAPTIPSLDDAIGELTENPF